MFKNYIKIAWRNLLKSKFYSVINLVGLTTGLAVGLLILLWVQDEISFDSFYKNAENIYRVNAHIGKSGSVQHWDFVQPPVATFALKEIPGVEQGVRIQDNANYSVFKYKDRSFKVDANEAYYVDPSFFKFLNINMIKGDAGNPFPAKNSIVITSSLAKQYFGSEDAVGKVLVADDKENLLVSGVVPDFKNNSSINCPMMFSTELLKAEYAQPGSYWKSLDNNWGNFMMNTYLQLKPGTNPAAVAKTLGNIYHRQFAKSNDASVVYELQPLNKIHLFAPDGSKAAMQSVLIFMVVAIFILLIACINYVNLSTARAVLRAKEVSVRKIIGAGKKELFMQFIVETVIFFVIALLLAFLLIKLFMPLYNQVSGKAIEFNLFNAGVWRVIGFTVLGTVAASSIYPALLLSSFKPISALKGKLAGNIGSGNFRKLLVVVQFSFSIMLIIGTVVISKQLNYIRSKQLGYDKSHVFSFWMRDMAPHHEAVRAALLARPGVLGVTTGSTNIIKVGSTTGDNQWDGKAPDRMFMIHPIGIDHEFIPLFKIKLVAGNNFTGTKADSAHYILNETALKEMGLKNPLGKRFNLWGTEGTIIGIAKDFHFASLKQKIEPAVFRYLPSGTRIYIKTSGRDASLAIKAAERIWKQYNPAYPFEYRFLDENYDELYKADQRAGKLFNIFALITIMISCLGLLGLATYTAQVKTKEIGIRKVLGASVSTIVSMLAKDFLGLILIAVAIAAPVAWWAMNKWLQDYAYRINVQWWMIMLSGVLAVGVALLTISFQSIKAALANPVRSLRSE